MHAVARAIHVLVMCALETERHVEGMLRELGGHGVGETSGTHRALASDGNRMEVDAIELAVPRFREEVRLMTAAHEGLQEALQIQLRAARGGELAANEGELHLGVPTKTRSSANSARTRKGSHGKTGRPVLPPPSRCPETG